MNIITMKFLTMGNPFFLMFVLFALRFSTMGGGH